MTWYPQHQRIPTTTPALTTLAVMGRTAQQAANTVAFREWASRLAARAGPRDYVGQLRELYDGINKRWRYVQESGEWVHGTPRSLIAHVLGTKYDQPNVEPTRARLDLANTKDTRGFGDCDDVATAIAAGVQSLGMRPFFRVIGPPAHVSVVAMTPKGRAVSLDPVGHPDHPFGWAAPSRSGVVRYFNMQGLLVGTGPSSPLEPKSLGAFAGVEASTMEGNPCTYFSGFDAVPRARLASPHWAAVRATDVRGPRVFAVSPRTYRMLRRGQAPHGHAAVDEFGEVYEYSAPTDLWLQKGTPAAHAHTMGNLYFGMFDTYADYVGGVYGEPMSGPFSRLRKRLKRLRRRIRRGIRRVARRAGKAIRKVGKRVLAPILRSKWAQRAVGAALQAVGIPRRLTAGFMAAAGSLIKKIGIRGLIRLIRKDRKKALRILAAAGKAGLRAAARPFGAVDANDEVMQTWLVQRNVEFPAQQVLGFVAAPVFGQYDLTVADEPTPGMWYRIKRGDTLLKVAGEAYDVGPGRERLQKARWINNVQANAVYVDPGLADNLFKGGRISFRPRYASDPEAAIRGDRGTSYALIFIPEAEGDEPAEVLPPPAPTGPELPDVPDEPEPPMPPPEEPEPVPPPEPEPPAEPAPEPEPTPPTPPAAPAEPTPPPAEPDVPEPPAEPPGPPPMPAGFAEACRNVGGQPVWTPATGWGCVRCAPGTVWSEQAGRCIPHLAPQPPAPPGLPELPDVPEPAPAPPPTAPPPTMPPPGMPELPDVPDIEPAPPPPGMPPPGMPPPGMPGQGLSPLLLLALASYL